MLLFWSCLLLSKGVFAAAVHQQGQKSPELLIPPELLNPNGWLPLAQPLFGLEEPKVVKADKSWTLQPRIRKDAVRRLIRFGPFEVPGLPSPDEEREWVPENAPSMDPIGTVITASFSEGFCQDCTVLEGRTDLAYENGTRADISNGMYLHHVLTIDRSKAPPTFVNTCPGRFEEANLDPLLLSFLNPFGMLFLGGGNDGSNVRYSAPDTNVQSGYYIKNNTFAVSADVVNYNKEKKRIYITYDVEYLPGKIGRDAVSTLLSVTGCGAPGFIDEAPVSSQNSVNFTLLEEGWIINARGHLHDGGEAMQLFHNGQLVCNSTATYGGQGGTVKSNGTEWKTISAMSDCQDPVKVKKGDSISMTSHYDTIKHPLRESDGMAMEEMGMFSIAFVPFT